MKLAIYLIVGFVVCFIIVKKRGPELAPERMNFGDLWFDKLAFWDIAFTTLLWPIVLPMKLAWQLMNRIWKKYNPQ